MRIGNGKGRALAVLSSVGGLLLAGWSPVQAVGGTVSEGDATFSIAAYGAAPLANLTGVSSNLETDHLFQSGWWYRFADDTREYPFPNPDSETWGGIFPNHASLEWQDLGGRAGVYVAEGVQVFDTSYVTFPDPSGYVTRTLQVHNFTGETIEIDVFHYADLDIVGAGGDSAELREVTPALLVEIRDAGGTVGAFSTSYALGINLADVKYRVALYTTNLLALLNDTLVNDFANTGLPMAAGDFTGILQFHLTIPHNQILTPSISLSVGAIAHCTYFSGLFCDGFELGSTSIWSSRQQ